MKKISQIKKKVPTLHMKKRVAAYARVSRESERLLHSFSAQVSYYSSKIQRNPNWEYVGVYADEGITGTSVEKRSEFQRLIEDCDDGKIDIVLVKSISRFGRNTVDVLQTTRHLKNIGVEVIFEEQNIHSLDSDGELMLTILASFAEQESKNISENIRWANMKKAEKGLMLNNKAPYGYKYDPEGKKLIVVPEQADLVKRIYKMYLEDDLSVYQIAKILNAEGIPSPRNAKWAQANLRRMIQNPAYVGDLLLGKYYSDGPLTQKHKKNYGEKPMYYAEETHEAIIDKETFEKVQEKFRYNTENGCYRSGTKNCFSRTIICGSCGKTFHRQNLKLAGGKKVSGWACKPVKGPKCAVVTVIEEELKDILATYLEITEFDEAVYTENVDHLMVDLEDNIHIYMRDGNEYIHSYPRRRKLRSTRKENYGQKSNGNSGNDQ